MQAKRVALLIETSSSWGGYIISGIGEYVRRHERWVLHLDHRGYQEPQLLPPKWEVDGVIARVTNLALAESILRQRLPCVNVSQYRLPIDGIQHVTSDERRVGQNGAETLISTGLRNFAYYGPPPREYYTDKVLAGFGDSLSKAGYKCTVIDRAAVTSSGPDRSLDLPALSAVLKELARPIGVLTWNCLGAHHINEACQWASLGVPEEVSILAGDYDQLTTELSSPRITCLDQVPRRIGFVAGRELDRLMNGGSVKPEVFIEPEGLVSGESLATPAAIDDRAVVEAVELIEANAARNVTIEQLLEVLATSRRNLERRFHQALGYGPAAAIRKVRLRDARKLLEETELPIKAISAQCGFANAEQLQRLLRTETGLTPSEYRDAHRRPPTKGAIVLREAND